MSSELRADGNRAAEAVRIAAAELVGVVGIDTDDLITLIQVDSAAKDETAYGNVFAYANAA